MSRLIDANALIADCQLAQKQADRHGREFANAFYSGGGEISTEWWCVEDMIENAPTIEAERKTEKWIPCSERLPKEEKRRYWICTDTGYQCQCRWTNASPIWTHLTTDWHWSIFDIPQYSQVIAWMQLPEPWKGGEE